MRSKPALMLTPLVLFLSAAVITRGEIAPQSPDELTKKAKTIVIGKVNGVYKQVSRSDDWEDIGGLVEISVEKVEKGDGVKQGDIIFARFWNRYWIGKKDPPPYGTGHHLHQNGSTIRAHLMPGNGAYDILLPNGLVLVEQEKPTAAK